MLILGGIEKIIDLLVVKWSLKIVVIGGLISVLMIVVLLLKGWLVFGVGVIMLLYCCLLWFFYYLVEVVYVEGFIDFGFDDICLVLGFVYWLVGFWLEVCDLVLWMLLVDGCIFDLCVVFYCIIGDVDEDVW